MNAIQYGAQAGALGQIAQGNSLRRVFGTDAAGFESNYKAMANTQADMQNITARETTRSAREHFGAGLQGGGSNGISYAHAAHSNADLKHDQFAGTAQGYDDAMAEAKAKGIEGSPFQAQARNDTKTQGNTTTGNIKQGIENMKNEAAAKAGQDFVEGNSAMLDSIAEKANQNAAMKSEIMNREMRGTDAGTVSAGILKDKYAPIMKENEAKIERMSAMFNERKEALERSAEQAVDLDPNSQQKALDQMAKANTAANVEQQLERTSSYQAAIGTGALNPSTGTFSQNFRAGASYNAAQSYANVLATSSNLSNTAALSQQMQDMGLNQAQISNVLAGGTTERGIRLAALTGQAAMRGSFQGRSFMLNASSDGQYNGSFDSSLNVRGGYNVDMGTATAAAGYQAGGVSGMRAVGITQAGWNFATETASNVMMFAPGGGFAKGAARLGVINPSSRYHMGIGQYRNMMSNKAASVENQGASAVNQGASAVNQVESIGVNSTIPNGEGGYVNLNELF